MKTRSHIFTLLLSLAALASFGCHHRIVAAAMPAPMPPRPVTQAQSQTEQAPPVIPSAGDPAPQVDLPAPDPASAPAAPAIPAPARPRTAPADPAKANPEPTPEAPVIAPALSQKDLANAVRLTNNDQSAAQRTLVRAGSRRLNPSQADLYAKIKGFLDQTEDAKKANDWVRAQNLAHKAQILALELMKSL